MGQPDIYVLGHSHYRGSWSDDNSDEKVIGYFDSLERAAQALETLRAVEGFVDYPSGFRIYVLRLDDDAFLRFQD